MIKKLILTTSLALVIPLSTSVLAQGYGWRQPGYCFLTDVGPNFLNLSSDQQTQINKLVTEHIQKVQKLKTELQLKNLELNQLMSLDDPNYTTIENKVKEISKIKEQLQLERVRHMTSIQKILTPEQRTKFPMYRGMRYGNNFWKRGFGLGLGPGNRACPFMY